MYHNDNKKNLNEKSHTKIKSVHNNSRYILNYITKKNSEKIPLVVGIKEKQQNKYEDLEKILDCCYLDILTGKFHCKICHNVVAIDLSRFYIFCPKHGLLLNYPINSIKN